MSRKVVLVIGQLHQGGAEGQLVHLALGLAGSKYAPVVACLSEVAEPHASRLRGGGIPVKVFPRRSHRDPGRLVALARFLRAEKADLTHAFLVGANAYAYAASRLSGRRRFVASSRTSMKIPGAASRRVHSWVFRHASAVIANSRAVKEFTASYYGVPAERIRVVPNGVAAASAEDASGREKERTAMGAVAGGLLIGTLGRLSREKNLTLFLEIAGELAPMFPGARFVVIGDGPERAALEAAVTKAELAGRVRMAGGRADVNAALCALDLFVLTSGTEGLPNAVMEAMGAGLPVVASAVGGTGEVVDSGRTGFLVPPGGKGPFVEALRSLMTDPAARRRMGAAGRERIASEFTVERMVAGTAAVYDEMVAGSG